MTAHVVEIETDKDGLEGGGDRYRWRCSCLRPGPWQAHARSARNGGTRHVAAMERAK